MNAHAILLIIHRWAGLLLAVQVALWMASGVVMSLIPLAKVRGETAAAFSPPAELAVQNYFPPAGVVADFDGATSVTLKTWLGRTVYRVESGSGAALYDADTGDRITPIPEALARRVAEADFTGEGEVEKAVFLKQPPPEADGRGALWQVTFNDKDRTRLYVSPDTGEIAARRSRVWRFYDFFWMLHIMDYKERTNFNNPLLQVFSVSGLIFALTGLALVGTTMVRGRFGADLRRVGASKAARKKAAE